MFWNGNYVATREVSTLLKEKDVTLMQLLDADDIIQECQAKNTNLVKFLTRPEVISELVGLIVEEPSPHVELQAQYRYSSVACEVLTSGIGTLNDVLSGDATQMHRLCDFIAKEPPLNSLLASFFSKTVKALLEQSPKQDWYTYNIICLRVLEFFRSRGDFLPNLFRHIGTSAIMDIFKFLIRLDIANKIVLQWFEEHNFIDVLIHMLCGTYVPEKLRPPVTAPRAPTSAPPPDSLEEEKGDAPKENGEYGEEHVNSKDDKVSVAEMSGDSPERSGGSNTDSPHGERLTYALQMHKTRVVAGRAASAANLLCDIILVGCYGESGSWFPQSCLQLAQVCKSERVISQLLQSVFTSPAQCRRDAVVGCCQVLLCAHGERVAFESTQSEAESYDESRRAVVIAIAPHLPLLHQTLLQDVTPYAHSQNRKIVGVARLQVATLIASLMSSPAEEVAGALLALGTLNTLLELFLACPGNNLLHAQFYRAVRAGLHSAHRTQYARHLIHECDLLTRLMDAFEDNQLRAGASPRSGHMGHVRLILELLQLVLDDRLCEEIGIDDELLGRWRDFTCYRMQPLFRFTPLGGYHPANEQYEEEVLEISMIDTGVIAPNLMEQDLEADDNATDAALEKYYSKYSFQIGEGESGGERRAHELEDDDDDTKDWTEYSAARRLPFDVNTTANYPDDILHFTSPWVSAPSVGAPDEGWAQFGSAEEQFNFANDNMFPESNADISNMEQRMGNIHILDNLTNSDSTELVTNIINAIVAPQTDLNAIIPSQINTNTMVAPQDDTTTARSQQDNANTIVALQEDLNTIVAPQDDPVDKQVSLQPQVEGSSRASGQGSEAQAER